jgi:hypothetical protein
MTRLRAHGQPEGFAAGKMASRPTASRRVVWPVSRLPREIPCPEYDRYNWELESFGTGGSSGGRAVPGVFMRDENHPFGGYTSSPRRLRLFPEGR